MPPPFDSIENSSGERIAASFTPGRDGQRAIVVIGHGLTSDRERPWSCALSDGLAERGIASLRIAFSGNGDSGGRFEDSNITKEVLDLGAVLDALDGWRVAYVGHSMGGAVGLLRATEDERIRALVSLAAIAHTRAFVERLFGALRPGELMLDKPGCPLTQQFADDLTGIGSVAAASARVRAPWLLVHGGADEVVPAQDSIDVHAAAGGRAELALLEGVDHSFTGTGLERMTGVVLPWLAGRAEFAQEK